MYICIYIYMCIHIHMYIYMFSHSHRGFLRRSLLYMYIYIHIHFFYSHRGFLCRSLLKCMRSLKKTCVPLPPANTFAINSRRKSAATHCNTLQHTRNTSCRLRPRNHPGLSNNYRVPMQKSPLFPQKSAIYPEKSPTSARKRAL